MLGVVQGITEFLPISSTGHLVILEQWLQLDAAVFNLSFDVMVHLGTLLAVVIYFRVALSRITRAVVMNTDSEERQWGWWIIISTLLVAAIAFVAKDFIEQYLRNTQVIAIALIIGAIVFMWVEYVYQKRKESVTTVSSGILIGLSQILALIPGMSRSGITLSTALAGGVNRTKAAEYVFLLSFPIIALASLYNIYELFISGISIDHAGVLVVGLGAAALSGYAAIAFFISYIQKHTLVPFAVYRIILGIILLTLL